VNSQRRAFTDANISRQKKDNVLSTVGAIGGAYASHSMNSSSSGGPEMLAGSPVNQKNYDTQVA